MSYRIYRYTSPTVSCASNPVYATDTCIRDCTFQCAFFNVNERKNNYIARVKCAGNLVNKFCRASNMIQSEICNVVIQFRRQKGFCLSATDLNENEEQRAGEQGRI